MEYAVIAALVFLVLLVFGAGAFIYEMYWGVRSMLTSVDTEAWQSVARDLNLTFEEGISQEQPYIVGVIDEVSVSAATHLEPRGSTQIATTVISATIASDALAGAEVRTQKRSDRLLSDSKNDLHPELQEFVVSNASHDQLALLGQPAPRQALLKAQAVCGTFEIDASEVVYRSSEVLNDPRELRERIETIAAVARAVESTARELRHVP